MELEDKIQQIIDNKCNSPSQFADEIGVPRSTISHIMAGRNRPSLDLVQKIMARYPELGTRWILDGEKISFEETDAPSYKTVTYTPKRPVSQAPEKPLDLFSNPPSLSPAVQSNLSADKKGAENLAPKKIERILIFFSDGTFREYVEGAG